MLEHARKICIDGTEIDGTEVPPTYAAVVYLKSAVNSKKTGTIPGSRILKPFYEADMQVIPQSSLTIKHYNTRVFLPYMAAPSGHKFSFTQSYGRSYGGIVPVFIEFTGNQRHSQASYEIRDTFKTETCFDTVVKNIQLSPQAI